MFGNDVSRAAREHALSEWPRESCGVVAGGVYHPVVAKRHPDRWVTLESRRAFLGDSDRKEALEDV